jgi:hypothetical protein
VVFCAIVSINRLQDAPRLRLAGCPIYSLFIRYPRETGLIERIRQMDTTNGPLKWTYLIDNIDFSIGFDMLVLGGPIQMKSNVRTYHLPTEVRKFLKGKKTKADLEMMLRHTGPAYLEMIKAQENRGEPKDIAELERMFNLEDPRG